MTSREDVLNRALVHLHPILHQRWVLVEYFERWQDGEVSDVQEPDFALNLVKRHEGFAFDFQLKNRFFFGPNLIDELFGLRVGLANLLTDLLCVFIWQLM